MVTKKGSKEWKAKLSKAQKRGWKKRRALEAAKSYTIVDETIDPVSHGVEYAGTTKATLYGPKSNVQNIPKSFRPEEFLLLDNAINPAHYQRHPSGIECIVITEHFNFNRGNAIKYIWRADEKGSTIENLRKAQWYLNRELSRLEKEALGQ